MGGASPLSIMIKALRTLVAHLRLQARAKSFQRLLLPLFQMEHYCTFVGQLLDYL
jgi:hypothetical protein